MSQVKKLKASERMAIANEIVKVLQKRYRGGPPKAAHSTLETLIQAVLVEDSPQEEGDAALARFLKAYPDLNEARVSSISEIEAVLLPLHSAGWKAVRVREVLQYTFEKYYQFDLEQLRRKTSEQAEKQLKAIKHLTPFMLLYLQQHSLQQHTIPLDAKSRDALVWLGLIEPSATIDAAAEELKQVVRKADTGLFCHLVRCLATDPNLKSKFKLTAAQSSGDGIDPHEAKLRLNSLFTAAGAKAAAPAGEAQSKVVKKPAAKAESTRAAAKKAPAKKAPAVAKKVAKPAKAKK